MELVNKVAVVTGAGSGIGRAISLELADRGCALAISDINESSATETARHAEALGAKVVAHELNVADRDAVTEYARQVVDTFGEVNILINNAGISCTADPVAEGNRTDFDRVMDINLGGVVNGTFAFLPSLIESGDGALVNISSLNGIVAQPGMSSYCASKFAVRGFTEVVRAEMIVSGANVQEAVVHPGGVATNIATSGLERAQAETREVTAAQRARVRMYNEKFLRMDPKKAARIIADGIESGRPRIIVGNDARAFDALARMVPKLMPKLMGKAEKRMFSGAQR